MIDQEEIHKQCLSEYPEERIIALEQLKDIFLLIPNKEKTWNDLHRLANDRNSDVRELAANVLGFVFSYVPNLIQAWEDLHRLTSDENSNVRKQAVSAFVSSFSLFPDKQKAWNDLIKLANDENSDIRKRAAIAIDSAFPHVVNQQQAWEDLHKLVSEENNDVRRHAISSLRFSFSRIPDKQKAWNDLHRLTNDKNSYVRSWAVDALGSAFYQMPSKQRAWKDIHRLTNDKNSYVRSWTADALSSVYSHVSNKQKILKDLRKLTNDRDSLVRIYANHSLGKIFIFKASQAEREEDYKKELETAILFFEKAAQESFSSENWSNNPAQFCLPFYRSFHTIIFKKVEAKEEVELYIKEAKNAIRGSKSKELLFEAVNNLAKALNEVQNLENLDLEAKKSELNYYRKYCDRAAEIMIAAENRAPSATEVIRKGLPILNRNLKETIEEIQKKARIVCKESKGTDAEEIACAVSREVQKWEIGSQEEMTQKVEDIAYILKTKVANLPENVYVLNKIEAMRFERDLTKQYETLLFVIGLIPTMKVVSEQELDKKLDQKLQKFDLIFGEIVNIKDKLSCISFDISKIKFNLADFISDLKTMKEELEKLNKIEGLNTISIEKLDSIQAEKLNGLNNDILARLDEIKIIIDNLPKNDDTQKILGLLNEVKQSDSDTLLQRSSAIVTLISFVIPVLQKVLIHSPV